LQECAATLPISGIGAPARTARPISGAGPRDRAMFGQFVELRARQDRDVERGAVLDCLLVCRGQPKLDVDRHTVRPLQQR